MVNRPVAYNSYEFVVVSSLRAKQLLAGCVSHVNSEHTLAIKAQLEVAEGHVVRCGDGVAPSPRQCDWQL